MATLLLILVLHGLFLTGVLALHGRRGERGNRILAAVVLVASLLLLESYLATSGATSRWPHLRGVFRPLWFLLGPLCCLYVLRHLDRPLVRREVLLAALPTIAVGTWMLPYYWMPAPAKSGLNTYADGRWTTLAVYSGFSLLTSICALISYRQIRLAEDSPAMSEPAGNPFRLAWLRWLMGALCCYAILDLLASLLFIGFGRYPAALGYTSILILASLVYGTGLLVIIPDGLLLRGPWPKKGYGRSEITAGVAQRQIEALDHLMRGEKPWLDEDLTLGSLAARLGVSRHRLSQLMNQNLGTSFHDYVNRFRVEEAKRLLLDIGSRTSILDIGFSAGFGSSATFYRVFKKQVGASPKEFLAGTAGSESARFRSHSSA